MKKLALIILMLIPALTFAQRKPLKITTGIKPTGFTTYTLGEIRHSAFIVTDSGKTILRVDSNGVVTITDSLKAFDVMLRSLVSPYLNKKKLTFQPKMP